MIPEWTRKIRSGALQFSVFVAVLIAILLAGMILYAYTFVYLKQQSETAITNIQATDTGFDYLLQTNNDLSRQDTIVLTTGTEGQTIRMTVSPWGVFQKAGVLTTHRTKQFGKIGIVAGRLDRETSPTLYLKEENAPLVMVGNARITGKAFLPVQDIKPGYIAGNSFYGSQLVYGTRERSLPELPKLEPAYREQLKNYTVGKTEANRDENTGLLSKKRLFNSFKNKTQQIHSRNPLFLSDIQLTGNIMVSSDTLIVVKNTTAIKDVILRAPIVEIEEGTTGTFQVIATERIKVNQNCLLQYPSALLLVRNNLKTDNTPGYLFDKQLYIDENSQVKGIVGCLLEKASSDFYPQIVIAEGAKISGQLYCEGNLELKGTVSGSVYTAHFLVNHGGSVYLNHLFNGIIENSAVPDIYGGLLLQNQHKTVVKWMY